MVDGSAARPQRWRPYNDGGGRLKAITVVPSEWDAAGNVTKYKVWANGSPERDGACMTWQAGTLRRYFVPEPEGD